MCPLYEPLVLKSSTKKLVSLLPVYVHRYWSTFDFVTSGPLWYKCIQTFDFDLWMFYCLLLLVLFISWYSGSPFSQFPLFFFLNFIRIHVITQPNIVYCFCLFVWLLIGRVWIIAQKIWWFMFIIIINIENPVIISVGLVILLLAMFNVMRFFLFFVCLTDWFRLTL